MFIYRFPILARKYVAAVFRSFEIKFRQDCSSKHFTFSTHNVSCCIFAVYVVLSLVGNILLCSRAFHYICFSGEDFSLQQNGLVTFPTSSHDCPVYFYSSLLASYKLNNSGVWQWIATRSTHTPMRL